MALYILKGKTKGDWDEHSTLINTDEEGIWSLIRNNNHWKSLTVYECPKTSIYSQDEIERSAFLEEVIAKKKEAEERELYLKLKEKYEKTNTTTHNC